MSFQELMELFFHWKSIASDTCDCPSGHQMGSIPVSPVLMHWRYCRFALSHQNAARYGYHITVMWHVIMGVMASQITSLTFFSCDQAALWMVQSVRPSVRLSHLFDYVPINVSSWNFQELLPMTKVTSMQKVKVRGQRSRSQRSRPNLTVSGL